MNCNSIATFPGTPIYTYQTKGPFGLVAHFKYVHLKIVCFATSALNACHQNSVLPNNILSAFSSAF